MKTEDFAAPPCSANQSAPWMLFSSSHAPRASVSRVYFKMRVHIDFLGIFTRIYLGFTIAMSTSDRDIDELSGQSSGDEFRPRNQPLKQKKDPSKWKHVMAKSSRDSGQAYVSLETKREVAAKTRGPPCECPKRCYDVVGEENTQLIFNNYFKNS